MKNRFRVGRRRHSIFGHLLCVGRFLPTTSQSFTVLLWDMKDQMSLPLCPLFHPETPSWVLLAFWLLLPPFPLGVRAPMGRASQTTGGGDIPDVG